MLTAIGELATEQSQATKTTLEKLTQLLNYCASHPDATVRFTASDMILAVESDASYLSFVKGRSRAAGVLLLDQQACHASWPIQTERRCVRSLSHDARSSL